MPGMEKVNDLRVPPFTEQKSSWMSWLVSRRFNKQKAMTGASGVLGLMAAGLASGVAYMSS
jgi:hypothetical protein